MSTYTVKTAAFKKDVETQFGAMKAYSLILDGDGGPDINAELLQKAQTAPPTVGARIEGVLEETPYGTRLKKIQQGNGGGRGRSPEESRQIVRQHSQSAALMYAQIRATQGKLPEDFTLDDLFKIVDKFDHDAFHGSKQVPS